MAGKERVCMRHSPLRQVDQYGKAFNGVYEGRTHHGDVVWMTCHMDLLIDERGLFTIVGVSWFLKLKVSSHFRTLGILEGPSKKRCIIITS